MSPYCLLQEPTATTVGKDIAVCGCMRLSAYFQQLQDLQVILNYAILF